MNDYDFSPAIIGTTTDGREVLNFESILEILMASGDFDEAVEAQEYIDWNSSFGSTNPKPSVIFYPKYDEGETATEYLKEHELDDVCPIDFIDSAFIGTSHGGAICYDNALALSIIQAKVGCDSKTASRILDGIVIPMSENNSWNPPIFIRKSLDKLSI